MTKHLFKTSDLILQSVGIAKALEKNRRVIELATASGGIAKAIADNKRAIGLIGSGGGFAKAIANNQSAMKILSNGGIASVMEQNRRTMDLIASNGGLAKAMMNSRRTIEMISAGGAIAKAMEKNRRTIELAVSGSGFAKSLIDNQRSINSVLERFTEQGWYESAVAIVEDELKDDGLSPEKEVSGDVLSSELEFLSKADSSESFLKLFSKLPLYIKIILLLSISQVIIPQINSISANLITPHVEKLLSNEELSSREKVKKIKNIPLTERGYEFEGIRFISGNGVRLRKESNTKSEIIDSLDIGRVVVLLQKDRRWTEVQVQYDDGTVEDGWVHSRYVQKFSTKSNKTN